MPGIDGPKPRRVSSETGRDRVPELVDTYMSGELDLESLVTRRVALDDVNDAFEAMERQEGIRTVITY